MCDWINYVGNLRSGWQFIADYQSNVALQQILLRIREAILKITRTFDPNGSLCRNFWILLDKRDLFAREGEG